MSLRSALSTKQILGHPGIHRKNSVIKNQRGKRRKFLQFPLSKNHVAYPWACPMCHGMYYTPHRCLWQNTKVSEADNRGLKQASLKSSQCLYGQTYSATSDVAIKGQEQQTRLRPSVHSVLTK